MSILGTELQRQIAARSAVPMFGSSLTFLLCMAVLVVLWVDVPGLAEAAPGPHSAERESATAAAVQASSGLSAVDARFVPAPPTSPMVQLERLVIALMQILWPLFLLEAVFHWLTHPWNAGNRKFQVASLCFCLCPPLRMCARSPELGNRLWLPVLGWRKPDRHLRAELERAFSFPMLLIALMILPVLAVEFCFSDEVARWPWLRGLLHFSTGTIWFAFAAEFILMVSVAERKWPYLKAHWLDLAIILLPLVSFLRSLRIIRATRAAKFMRLQRLTKLARVYRLRAIGMKLFRAFILLELFHRLFGMNPKRRLRKLQQELAHRQTEIKSLQKEIAKMEALIEQQNASASTGEGRAGEAVS